MRFYPVTAQEMRDALRIERGWKEDVNEFGGIKEIVFSYFLKSFPFIQIKVYSGIKANDEQSRRVGQDAIRVCAVNTKTSRGWVKASRVYRVEGWRNNLQERVLQVIEESKKRINL